MNDGTDAGGGADDATEARVVARLSPRLIPFLIACFCVAYVDRVNVGFAALTMNHDLGFTPAVFGLGAGIFFIGYFALEVPSNIVLARVGARRSIARIMIGWGLLAAGTAFVTGSTSFCILRFVLGAAEAGFFPGVIYYLTLWFPAAHRGRVMGWFMASIPLSAIIGSPISGLLLGLDGLLGLHGWQWLFIVEGLPATLLGIAVLFVLTDRPEDAAWLDAADRDWLVARLDTERQAVDGGRSAPALSSLLQPKVLALSLVYFGLVTCTNAVGFWLPQIIGAAGLAHAVTGVVAAVPSLAGLAGMLTLGRRSDRTGERRLHCGFGLAIGTLGLLGSALVESPTGRLAGFALALYGFQGAQPIFWTIPTSLLTGKAAAAGLALINSIGGLAGFFGPALIGVVKGATGTYGLGMAVLAGFGLAAGAIVVAVGRSPQPTGVVQSRR